MTTASYIFGIAAAVLLLATVVEMLRRGRLRERHTLWWIVAGIVGLVFGIFPSLLAWFASLLGIEVPINLVFFLAIVALFLVCLQQSSELTKSEERIRTLAEHTTLLEDRIRQLELRALPEQSNDDTQRD